MLFQINEIYNQKAEYALFRLKGNFYESGEKSSKLLARQLRQKEASYAIPAVKNSKGELMMNTSDINKCLQVFITSYTNPRLTQGGVTMMLFSPRLKCQKYQRIRRSHWTVLYQYMKTTR